MCVENGEGEMAKFLVCLKRENLILDGVFHFSQVGAIRVRLGGCTLLDSSNSFIRFGIHT